MFQRIARPAHTWIPALPKAEHAIILSIRISFDLLRSEYPRSSQFFVYPGNKIDVVKCCATTGDADCHLRVVCASIEAYNDFLEGFLFQVEAVSNVRTNVVLKEIKVETKLPISE